MRSGTETIRAVPGLAIILAVAAMSVPGSAQTTGGDVPGNQTAPLIIDAVPAPDSDIARAYQDAQRRSGNRITATYAEKLAGDLPLDAAYRPPQPDGPRDSRPLLSGMTAWLAVVALVVILLALWLRFGGSGTLLAGTPKDIRQKPIDPEGWSMAQDQTLPMSDLLAEIAAMPDRRAALVRLLRHCLLQAGAATDTRFARSDTEREALRRLPEAWSGRPGLAGILTTTELAHYGGRAVSEDAFAASLATARALFVTRQGSHA